MYALELTGLTDPPSLSQPFRVLNVSRRGFLKTAALGAGSVLVLGVFSGCRPENRGAWPDRAEPQGDLTQAEFQPNVFIGLNTNGDVFIVCSRSEMGQGIRSSVPAIIADEMGASWERCHIVQADGHPRFGNQNTDGSRSIRNHFDDWRRAGATARAMLIAAACQAWQASPADCVATDHVVRHSDGREIAFGDLAEAASGMEVPESAPFRRRDTWRYIGTDIDGRDNRAFVTGAAVYGMDVRVPDMRYAAIARCPVLAGRLVRVDEGPARAVPGVIDIVRLPDATLPPAFQALGGVAVIAENSWAAFRGREALVLEWDPGSNAVFGTDAFMAAQAASAESPGEAVRTHGSVMTALSQAATTLEATYQVAMLPHASMEPPAATAWVKSDGTCEVWACTQAPQGARDAVASALGIDPEAVTVHVTFLGGGFGRKSKPDFIVEAALLSGVSGTPVKVVWSREDDLRHDYYHPPSSQHLRGGLNAQGGAVAWLHRSAYPSISTTFAPNVAAPSAGDLAGGGMSTVPYDIPHLQCESCPSPAHVRIGWLRSVYNIHHAFAINAFASELAHAAGRDAREFLLELIGPDRMLDDLFPRPPVLDTARLKAVVNRAADEAGWGKSLPTGQGMGIAAHFSFSSYVAHVVHASVENGSVRVHEVHTAIDCGTAVNLDRIRSQMEGATVFGLTLALKDGIVARDGAIETGNFDSYRLLLMNETPATHVHIMDSDQPPGGVGEPGVPPLAPALAGAVLQATGRPVRRLPIRLS